MPFFELIGVVGVIQILAAFFLLQIDRLSPKHIAYQMLNAAGAGFILFSLCFRFNLSAFLVELFWLLISVYGIYRIVADKRSKEAN